MARILCVSQGLAALLYSSLELSRRLEAAGHEVIYASIPEVGQTVRDHGLRFVPLEPSRYQQFVAFDTRQGVVKRLLALRRRRRQASESLAVGQFGEAIRDLDVDLVLIDGEMHEHIITAAATGVRVALLIAFVSIWRHPGLPPAHALVRPGVGWLGSRPGISLLWLLLRLRRSWRACSRKLRHLGCDRLSVLRRLAVDAGFDFAHETDFSQWALPFTYRRLPALSIHAHEFDFPHAPRHGVRYLGPLILERRVDHRVTDDVRGSLTQLFERRRSSRGQRKIIYAGFGSFFTTTDVLLKHLLEAVRGRGDWDLVLGLGDRELPTGLGQIPANAHLLRWAPQVEILRHADVAVTHGGMGTVEECICAGVPMLVYCGFETDMGGNAARVVHHGIGMVGDRQRDRPDTIRRRIDRLLAEPPFRENLERMRACHLAYAHGHVAERVVDSLLL